MAPTRIAPSARMDRRLRVVVAILSGALLLALAVGAWGQDPADVARGKALYEVACVHCHDRSIHDRKQLAARSFDDVRNYVRRWSSVAGQQWSPAEVHAVTLYLNARYYRYPCDTPDCKHEVTLRGR